MQYTDIDWNIPSPMVTAGPPDRNDDNRAHIHALGQLENGQFVVGLFNRNEAQTSGTGGPIDPESEAFCTAVFSPDELLSGLRSHADFTIADLLHDDRELYVEFQDNAERYGSDETQSDWIVKDGDQELAFTDQPCIEMVTGERETHDPFQQLLAMMRAAE